MSRATTDEEKKVRKRAYYLVHRETVLARQKALRDADVEAARARERAQAAKTPERNQKRAREWREQNPERKRALDKAYALAHPERTIAAKARYREKNQDVIKAKNAAAHAADPAKFAARRKAWLAAHPEQRAAATAKRRALRIGAVAGDRKAYASFVKWARSARKVRCYWCAKPTRIKKRHIDHIIPLSKGGADSVANLCVACASCNLRKNAKMPEDFAEQSEFRFS